MKKKMASLVMSILMVLLVLLSAPFTPSINLAVEATGWDGSVMSSFYSTGTGTPGDPYVIPNASYLAALARHVNEGNNLSGKYLVLGNDIDLSSDNAYGWTPIGTSSKPFKGIFNGNNKTVSGMLVRGTTIGENLGLFGVCVGATITNLTISNTTIYSEAGYVGTLCGNASGCTVRNITVTGNMYLYSGDDITAATRFGGMFGRVGSPATITNCKVSPTGTTNITHTIMASSSYGGFVGDIFYKSAGAVNISDCSVNNVRVVSNRVSNISDATYNGGFFGHTASDSVTVNFVRCGISDSTVSGYRYTGGFGYDLLRYSSMKGCYVVNVSLTDFYNILPSNGKIQTGGILGYNNGTVSNSYVSLASFSVPRQLSSTNFLYGNGHNVHWVVGVNGGYGSVSEVYYVEEQRLLYNGSALLDIGAPGYNNDIGEETTSAKVNNGGLGWELYDSEGGIYWTQKDNEFIRTNTGQVTSYPLPTASNENMIVWVSQYGDANSMVGGFCKFICTLDGLSSESTSYATRVDLYINAGTTLVDSVEANSTRDMAKAYTWYFTRFDPSSGSVLNVYGLEDKSFTVPAVRNATYILHGETEKVFNINYADPDGNILTPSSGAPTTFTLSNPASVIGVTATSDYWAVDAWQVLNGSVWETVTSVTTVSAQYADITLYAKWKLKSELGSDGKTYNLIYNFDNLEFFRDVVNNGQTGVNAKLCPEAKSYPTLSLGKTGTTFLKVTVHTDTLAVQSSSSRSVAELYILQQLLADDGFTVNTPERMNTVIEQLSSEPAGIKKLTRFRNQAEAQLDDLGLLWGEYNPGQIGTYGSGFAGVFDGNNHEIKGVTYGGELTANANGIACYGLFRYTNGATIKNLTLSGGTLKLTGTDILLSYNVYAAPLVSVANSTTISNCTVSVPVNTSGLTVDTTGFTPISSMNVGGVIGVGNNTTVNDCTSSGAITLGTLSGSSETYPLLLSVGGFVGYTSGSSVNINRCVRTGALKSTLVSSDVLSMGGAVGWANGELNVTDTIVMSDVIADPTQGTYQNNPLYIGGFTGRAGAISAAPVSFSYCVYNGSLQNYMNPRCAGYDAFNGVGYGIDNQPFETVVGCYYHWGADINTDDFRGPASFYSTGDINSGYVAWALQYEYGNEEMHWGQRTLGAGYPIVTSSPEYAVRRIFCSAGQYYTLGNNTCDVNGDFSVNLADKDRIVKGVVGIGYDDGGVDSSTTGADITGNGVIDALDAIMAEMILSGHKTLS